MTRTISHILRRLRRDQDGWALVTALILLTIMLSSTLAIAAYVDTETTQSRVGRNRETAFNLAEAAMNAQVFALANEWPGKGYDGPASQAKTIGAQFAPCVHDPAVAVEVAGPRCPNPTSLKGLFPTTDADPDAKWSTQIIDNDGAYPSFYSDPVPSGAKGCDCNDDQQVWVRASATVKGKTRTMIARVQAEQQAEDIIHTAVVAGSVAFGNNGTNGQKQFVDTGTIGAVDVRCDPDTTPAGLTCLGYPKDDSRWTDQLQKGISPYRVNEGFTDTAITSETLARLKQDALSNDTYYYDCPPSEQQLGVPAGKKIRIVVIDAHRSCSYSGGSEINTADEPGMLILLNSDSSLSIGGSIRFHGVIYHANLPAPGSSGPLVSITGNNLIDGGIIIDGNGGLAMQGSAFLTFNDAAFGSVKTIATAGIIQNTWRELTAGS